jgi:putative DNA modification/repair radical SAM protein
MDVGKKLEILSGAARYDVSCSSSGSERANRPGGLGNSVAGGICHSFAADGRCISLLKVLLSNNCAYDCAYCANRRGNDLPRASFTVKELVDLTMGFYLRNYIEGLFLSSGVMGSPDATMERMLAVVKTLRVHEHFNGYIHLKAIPGTDPRLLAEAGLYVDRMSVNIELPSRGALAALAPDKDPQAIFGPMRFLAEEARNSRELLEATVLPVRRGASAGRGPGFGPVAEQPRFLPAGQSTQLMVGASPEHDLDFIRLAQRLYGGFGLKRVYYSAYVGVNADTRLPALGAAPPLLREHRLYQADWLMRFYGFGAEEILEPATPWLDLELDPKAAWALRHLEHFPVAVQSARPEELLRVPGIGPRSVQRILAARRSASLREEDLGKLGVVLKRARPFVRCAGPRPAGRLDPAAARALLWDPPRGRPADPRQLELFT